MSAQIQLNLQKSLFEAETSKSQMPTQRIHSANLSSLFFFKIFLLVFVTDLHSTSGMKVEYCNGWVAIFERIGQFCLPRLHVRRINCIKLRLAYDHSSEVFNEDRTRLIHSLGLTF